MKIQARQGDVFLEKVEGEGAMVTLDSMDRVPLDNGRVILAYGEVTGHAHAIASADAELYQEPAGRMGDRYLKVFRETELRHEEHAKIILFPGIYRVTQQREYTPEAPRPVAD